MVHRLDDVTTVDGTDYPRTDDKKTVKAFARTQPTKVEESRRDRRRIF
ncbi:MAG: hypothetical protein FWH27_11915 [Planctomycetaceae bacterium]|nr:hypothetical protein [Planctomycetaceae bacterium]